MLCKVSLNLESWLADTTDSVLAAVNNLDPFLAVIERAIVACLTMYVQVYRLFSFSGRE